MSTREKNKRPSWRKPRGDIKKSLIEYRVNCKMSWRLRRPLNERPRAKLMQDKKPASNFLEKETIWKSKSRAFRTKISDFSIPLFDTRKIAPTNQSACLTTSRPIYLHHQLLTTTQMTSIPFATIKKSHSNQSKLSGCRPIRISCNIRFRMLRPVVISWKQLSLQTIASSHRWSPNLCPQFQ